MTEEEIHQINQHVARILEVQEAQVGRLKRIELALMGDRELGQEGVIARQARYDKLTDEHAQLIVTWRAKMFGAFMAATGLGGFINWFFNLSGHK